MEQAELNRLRKKFNITDFLSDAEYETAKKKYTNVRVKPSYIIPDVILGDRECYNGIPSLKKENIPVEYSEEMLFEYEKCMNDPVYFINAYVKIVHVNFGLVPFNLREFQEDIVQICDEFNKVILNASRQCGKCVHGDTYVDVYQNPTSNIKEPTTLQHIKGYLYDTLCNLKYHINS